MFLAVVTINRDFLTGLVMSLKVVCVCVCVCVCVVRGGKNEETEMNEVIIVYSRVLLMVSII